MGQSHKHHSGLDENDTGARMTHATGQGFARTIPAKHVFGTPDEIGHRVGGTFKTLPDRMATRFKQLGPESAGGNVNDKRSSPKPYSGNQKFGSPRRYT
jgi:hypothetical protein